MKPKENEFCEFYCLTENPREAAFKAGYRLFPEKKRPRPAQKCGG